MCIIKRKVNQLKRWNTWRSAPHTCTAASSVLRARAAFLARSISQKEPQSQIHMSDAASHIDEFESCRLPDTLRPPARPLAKSRCAQPWKDWAGLLPGNCRKKVDFMCDNRTDLLCAHAQWANKPLSLPEEREKRGPRYFEINISNPLKFICRKVRQFKNLILSSKQKEIQFSYGRHPLILTRKNSRIQKFTSSNGTKN